MRKTVAEGAAGLAGLSIPTGNFLNWVRKKEGNSQTTKVKKIRQRTRTRICLNFLFFVQNTTYFFYIIWWIRSAIPKLLLSPLTCPWKRQRYLRNRSPLPPTFAAILLLLLREQSPPPSSTYRKNARGGNSSRSIRRLEIYAIPDDHKDGWAPKCVTSLTRPPRSMVEQRAICAWSESWFREKKRSVGQERGEGIHGRTDLCHTWAACGKRKS